MSTEQTPAELGYGREPLRFAIPPGAPEKPCRSCGAPMIWIETPAGKRMPVNPDGTSHFSTCPNAAQHRKPKPAPERPLTRDHVRLLEYAERGETAPLRTYASRMTSYELRRWGFVREENGTLTPAGASALAKSRAR